MLYVFDGKCKIKCKKIYFVCRYLSESSSVESISTKLRKVCPSIYHSEDAACAKVNKFMYNISSFNILIISLKKYILIYLIYI